MSPQLRMCAAAGCGRWDEDDGNDYCAACRRERRAASQQARDARRGPRIYQTVAWRRRTGEVIAARGYRCEDCGMTDAVHRARHGRGLDVNHLDGDEHNWVDENLRVQCRRDHNAFDAARRRRIRKARIVAVVGLPGTGKSAVLAQMAETLSVRVERIDDWRRRDPEDAWTHLVAALARADADVLVESNRIPPGYQRLLRSRRSKVVLLRCDDAERERRLRARGDAPRRVAQLMRSERRPIRADVVIDTTDRTPSEVAADVTRRFTVSIDA